NLPFRRYVQTDFDNAQKSFLAGLGWLRLKVKSFKRRDLNFVQAHIQANGDSVADWLFRQVGDRWVISEPTSKQLGERQKVETEHFTFYTYPWADDVNATVIELVEQARQNAVERLGKEPPQKADVYIKPIYGLTPFDNPFYLAYYSPNRKPEGPDRIEIFAPHSMNFGFYDPAIGFEQPLETILTHEYAHMIHNRNFDNVGSLSSWMSEGLAEYVADNSRDWEIRAAVRTDNIIPIIDTVSPVYKQDLQHMETLEKDRSLAYGLACSLVAYIDEKHGGLEGFWKLAQAYEETQKLDVALKESFDVTFEEFDQGWRQWLEETYG
ncbi:MAG TPA: hypothetical protein VFO07_19625, partial [Roseiflexaceae bacterium]|nr:hypothetical protein [Roseiflexaceae bacterium]